MALVGKDIYGDIIALLVSVFIVIVAYFHYAYKYWERKGVPFLKPKFPMGNLHSFFHKSIVMGAISAEYYKKLKEEGHKFGGIYTITRPVLVLTDPEYIKDVMQKDFQYFIDRGVYHNEQTDPISNHLFNLAENSWKDMRVHLTPTFTSGKMKMMFNTVLRCSTYMNDFLASKANDNLDIDIKEVVASYTTDVIGACAFGIECNSFKNTEAEFRSMGRNIFNKSLLGYLRVLLISNLPELSLKMGLKATKSDISEFFFDVVEKAVKYREENNVYRKDFLQLLIELKNKENSNFDMKKLVAQVFVFFVAGFDTSSATITFTLYELARNPDIQEKVRNEINEILEKTNGEITYESLGEMKYLAQVVDETLRLYPALTTLTRKCVQDYKLRDTDVTIDKGTLVVISLFGMHRDPEHFPDPEKYDPERFSTENKNSRHPFAYIPFGEGPRNCIGLRFGQMQSKIGIINIVRNYKLTISPSTEMPLTVDPDIFLIRTKEVLYLKAEKIQ